MKIYSKFKDYYDNVGFYSPEARVWERKTTEYHISTRDSGDKVATTLSQGTTSFLRTVLESRPLIRTRAQYKYAWADDPDCTVVVGFCGKLYLGFMHYRNTDRTMYMSHELHNTYATYAEYMHARESDPVHKRPDVIKRAWTNASPFTEKSIAMWVREYQTHPRLRDIFVELKTPVFILQPAGHMRAFDNDTNFVVNPCLADYKLQHMFHPFTAHQEVDMYLGNDLAACQLKDFKMSDELKRDSKGMDKWSFKQKGPKARKRK